MTKFSEGCGDGSCHIKKPTGMHTNGGCRCFGKISNLKKLRNLALFLDDHVDKLEHLKRLWTVAQPPCPEQAIAALLRDIEGLR